MACQWDIGTYGLKSVPEDHYGLVYPLDEDLRKASSESHEQFVWMRCVDKSCGMYIDGDYSSSIVNLRNKRSDTYNVSCDELSKEEIDHLKQDGEYKKVCSLEGKDTNHRIVGGEEAFPNKWPSTVAIYRNGVFICGATVLNEDWIISAGHCFYSEDGMQEVHFQARAGMLKIESQSPWDQYRNIEKVFTHPNYDNVFLKHDVAIAKLNAPLNFNRHVQPMCLPLDSEMSPTAGSTCWAAGWGDLSEFGPAAKTLREVSIPILEYCGRSYNNVTYQICGGYYEGGKDACQGDSGGPLYCYDHRYDWYLAGVISHGKGCARPDEPGVYVRLSFYLDWVDDVLFGKAGVPSFPSSKCKGVQCSSGKCVSSEFVCDLEVHCLDGRDEANCVTFKNGSRIQVQDSAVEENETELYSPSEVFQVNSRKCEAWEFKCTYLQQCIPMEKKCDGIRDCPDWSDESTCKCGDLISQNFVCDGREDCRDGSDEVDCDLCEDDQWLCPLSGECINMSSLCNVLRDCYWGEDEMYCARLVKDPTKYISNEYVIPLSSTMSEGILMQKIDKKWQPFCTSEFSKTIVPPLCRYMGFRDGSNFELKSPSVYTTAAAFLKKDCSFTHIMCDSSKCGLRSLYRNVPEEYLGGVSGPGTWPWQASLFSDGKYICGGTIVHERIVMTHKDCYSLVEQSGNYHTVLVGQVTRSNVGLNPYSQTRRLVHAIDVPDSSISLALLDETLILNPYSQTRRLVHAI